MMVPWKALDDRHTTTAQCAKGVERKRHQLTAEETREIMVRDFQAYGRPLESLKFFKYLGRIIKALDDNWPEVVGDLRKLKKIWSSVSKKLVRE